MASTLVNWLRNLRTGLNNHPEALSDAELLARFLMTQDEDAFAALVARHGAMVIGDRDLPHKCIRQIKAKNLFSDGSSIWLRRERRFYANQTTVRMKW